MFKKIAHFLLIRTYREPSLFLLKNFASLQYKKPSTVLFRALQPSSSPPIVFSTPNIQINQNHIAENPTDGSVSPSLLYRRWRLLLRKFRRVIKGGGRGDVGVGGGELITRFPTDDARVYVCVYLWINQ